MKVLVTLFALGMFLPACGGEEVPVEPVVDGDSQDTDGSAVADSGAGASDAGNAGEVDAKAVDGPVLSGFVSLGRAVDGASVEVRAGGEVVGSAATGAGGFFEVSLGPIGAGRVEVRAFGVDGRYLEVAGGGPRNLDSNDVLRASVWWDPETPAAGVSVNALTTLALALAEARVADGEAVETAHAWATSELSLHLVRPLMFDLVFTATLDPGLQDLAWPSALGAVGLFHAGLSRMASDLDVATTDVLEALVQDLGDGIFDGKINGAAVSIPGSHAIDANTTRWALAAATDGFIDDPSANATTLDYAILAADEGFYTLVSTDHGPLYPPDAAAKRFDELGPVITWSAPTPPVGSWVRQDFDIRVQASDDSPLTSITLDAPAITGGSSVMGANVLEVTIAAAGLDQGALQLAIIAVDASGNSGTATRDIAVDTISPVVSASVLPLFKDPAAISGAVEDATSGLANLSIAGISVQVDDDGTFFVTPAWIEGANKIVVLATDVAGNLSDELELTAVLDTTPPIIEYSGPVAEFVGKGDIDVVASANDANGVAEFSANGIPFVDGVATLPAPAEDGALAIEVNATDNAGNSQTHEQTVNYDTTPPILDDVEIGSALESDGKHWVKLETTTVVVTATDIGAGIAGVCGGDPCVGTLLGGSQYQIVFSGLEEGFNTRTIIATDKVGNSTDIEVNIYRDNTPPTCLISGSPTANLVTGGLWFGVGEESASFAGTSTDAGVGAVSVSLVLDNGTALAGTMDGSSWSAGAFTLASGTSILAVSCADAFNNTSGAIAQVHLDLEPPQVSLLPTSFIKEDAAVWSFDGGVAMLNLPPGPTIIISEDACPQDDCSSTKWPKFANQMAVTDDNLPSVALETHDFGDAKTPDGDVSLTFRFERQGGALTADKPVDSSLVVPVAVKSFAMDADAFTWSPELVPDALVLTATDYAGNQSTRTLLFQLIPLAPPLFLSPIPTWPLEDFDLGYLVLGGDSTTDLAAAFSIDLPPAVSNYEGIRFARYHIHNPHDVAVEFAVQDTLKADISWTEQQVFVPVTGSVSPCLVQPDCSGIAACDPDYQKQCVDPASNWAVSKGAPNVDAELRPESWTVGGGATTNADVLVKSYNLCPIGAATDYSGTRIHPAGKECTYGSALAAGWEASCRSNSGPPLNLCSDQVFHTPMAVTSFGLASAGPATLHFRLPGFISDTSQTLAPLSGAKTIDSNLPVTP